MKYQWLVFSFVLALAGSVKAENFRFGSGSEKNMEGGPGFDQENGFTGNNEVGSNKKKHKKKSSHGGNSQSIRASDVGFIPAMPENASCGDRFLAGVAHQRPPVKAKIALEYFQDILKDSKQECFVVETGKVYDLKAGTAFDEGASMVEVRDRSSDIYRWIPKDQISFNGPDQGTIKSTYIESLKAEDKTKCFTMAKDRQYSVLDAHMAQGLLMVKIVDSESGTSEWMNSARLNAMGDQFKHACPDQSSEHGSPRSAPAATQH